jgi:hypothetical protein
MGCWNSGKVQRQDATAGAPKSCKAQIGNPKHEGDNDADRLEKAFAQLATPVSTTKAVFIQCAP